MVKVCAMRRPTSRVLHHQNDQDRGELHIARLLCICARRFVLCCPGKSESVSLRLAPECFALPSLLIFAHGTFEIIQRPL